MSAILSRRPRPFAELRAIALAVFAVAVEGYDITIYGLFALAVGHAFFPARDATGSLLFAVGSFGVGYIMRPIGGLVMGVYADRAGRRPALALTVILMAVSTGIVGLVPSYAAIGIAAPVIVVIARLLQGFSAGGAGPGSIAYLAESAAPSQRGFIASWQQASQIGAFLLTSAVASAMSGLLGGSAQQGWTWRAPFLLALLLGPVGLYVRKHLSEPEPIALQQAARSQGLVRGLIANAPAIASGVGLGCLWNVAVFVLLFYMPTYVQSQLGMAASNAYMSSTVSSAALFALCPCMGALSDRWGRKRVMLTSALLLLAIAYPMLHLLVTHRSLSVLMIVQLALAVPSAGYVGPIPAMMAELFPTSSRSTAVSVADSASSIVLGAFGPLLIMTLIAATHDPLALALYVCGGAAISAATLVFVKDFTGQPLRV